MHLAAFVLVLIVGIVAAVAFAHARKLKQAASVEGPHAVADEEDSGYIVAVGSEGEEPTP